VRDDVIMNGVDAGPDDGAHEETQPPIGEWVVILLDAVGLVGVAEHLVPPVLLAHSSPPSLNGIRLACSMSALLRLENAHQVHPTKQTRKTAVSRPINHPSRAVSAAA
jgi:hypothetical protein